MLPTVIEKSDSYAVIVYYPVDLVLKSEGAQIALKMVSLRTSSTHFLRRHSGFSIRQWCYLLSGILHEYAAMYSVMKILAIYGCTA